jgi:1,4-dihydroxy-6-naphthoate synthase
MKLTFAYSPCPNDTFMFEPIVSGRIDTEGLRFDIHLADVEELNKSAFDEKYDITKLSFNAYTKLTTQYQLLNSGSALGRKCGPLLISKKNMSSEDVRNGKIAIPGINTTANFLLSFAYPDLKNKSEMIFSEVEAAVLTENADAGVIIHENRFTFQDKGLVQIKDLGEHWEEKTGFPIPLGGIVTRRRFTKELKQKIDRVIARSVAYALAHPESGNEYIRSHAQEMDIDVMKSHINLYVNDFSANIGEEGRAAIYHLFENHPLVEKDNFEKPLFVPESDKESTDDFLTEDYWTSRYVNNMSGWDVGEITPPIKAYVDTIEDKTLTILIPGAGNAYEAEYLHNQGFTNVTICDLSMKPLKNLKERCPSFPDNHLIQGDFFDLDHTFDLIIEQTFFCAINPSLREPYAKKSKSILNPNGQIIGLMFDVVFPFNGPPFGGCMADYKMLFSKYFDNVSMEKCTTSIAPRLGNEIFVNIRSSKLTNGKK